MSLPASNSDKFIVDSVCEGDDEDDDDEKEDEEDENVEEEEEEEDLYEVKGGVEGNNCDDDGAVEYYVQMNK